MSSFVVYCDESSHTNPKNRPFYAIGSIWVPTSERDTISRNLRNLRNELGLKGEIKWQKVSKVYLERYCKYAQFFFESSHLRFRAIIVDQRSVDYPKYHDGDKELGFYKFYYHMLHHWFQRGEEYLVLLDYKNNAGAERYADLRSVLCSCAAQCEAQLKDLKIIDSSQSNIMQLTDLLTGAVATAFNDDFVQGSAKHSLINSVAGAMEWDHLKISTSRDFQKFNIFKINLR